MSRLKATLAAAVLMLLGLTDILQADDGGRTLFCYAQQGAVTPTLLDVFLGPSDALL
ncbi:MAG: hypothetical protein ACE5K7_02155 [Phycisphaerae bacterium]